MKPQGSRCAPNPGLELANAFGVINPRKVAFVSLFYWSWTRLRVAGSGVVVFAK